VPVVAVPSIFGEVVLAALPSGISVDVMKPLSLVKSEVFVGTATPVHNLIPVPSYQ
jgi:hypothetical protein